MIDAAVQRRNMVDNQVRPSDVTDRRIIRAMLQVPRERYLPGAMQMLAYSDGDVDLGVAGRALMAPRTFAKLVQLCELEPEHRVLAVGCGTGYSLAVLTMLAGAVVGLEGDAGLAAQAQALLPPDFGHRVQIVTGAHQDGYAEGGPYDVILIEGAVEILPQRLIDQVRDGGRIVGIEQSGGVGRAVIWRRTGKIISEVAAFDATAAEIPGFSEAAAFAL